MFDTMMKTSFEMIRENSTVMHKYMMATVGKTDETSKTSRESDSGKAEPQEEDQSA